MSQLKLSDAPSKCQFHSIRHVDRARYQPATNAFGLTLRYWRWGGDSCVIAGCVRVEEIGKERIRNESLIQQTNICKCKSMCPLWHQHGNIRNSEEILFVNVITASRLSHVWIKLLQWITVLRHHQCLISSFYCIPNIKSSSLLYSI